MNKRQAAIQAGYNPSNASVMAKRLTDRLTCNRYFLEEAHRQGLTIEAIITEIKRGMTESMNPTHPDLPDNYNRSRYVDMALKIYGGYSPLKFDIKKDSRESSVMISIDTIRKVEEFRAEKILDKDENIINQEDEETEIRHRDDLVPL